MCTESTVQYYSEHGQNSIVVTFQCQMQAKVCLRMTNHCGEWKGHTWGGFRSTGFDVRIRARTSANQASSLKGEKWSNLVKIQFS